MAVKVNISHKNSHLVKLPVEGKMTRILKKRSGLGKKFNNFLSIFDQTCLHQMMTF